MIKSYWVLDKDLSVDFKAIVDSEAQAKKEAKEYVKKHIKCDEVFICNRMCVYLGFADRQNNPDLHKKPHDFIDGYNLYLSRAKSETHKAVKIAESIARKPVKFKDFCKDKFPSLSRSIMSGDSGKSLSIWSTSFGFYNDQVVALVPFADSDVDLTIIPEGFKQITEIELNELRRGHEITSAKN